MSAPLATADARRTRRALGGLLRAHAGGFAVSVLALALGAVASVATPLLLGAIIDAVTAEDSGGLRTALLLLAGAVVAQAATTAWSRVAVASVGERMLARLRTMLVARVLRMPERRVEAAGRGEVVARVSGDVAVVGETVSSIVPGTAAAAFSIAAAAAGMGVIDLRLTLAACIAIPIQWFALRHYLRRSQPVYRASREAAGDRSQRILESLDAHPTLVAFGITERAEEQIDEASRRAAELTMRATRLGVRFWGRLNLAELVGLAGILVAGFLLVRDDVITLGSATAAALMFLQLFGPIGTVLAGFDDLQRAGASLARLVGVLDEPIDPEAVAAPGCSPGRIGMAVDAIDFAYAQAPVLSSVTLELAPGEHVAVVGASGAGKSTLAAIICGRLAPTAGSVRFTGDDQPRVALVTQENHVFAGPLRDDLRLVRPDASDDELRRALRLVGAEGWVSRLDDGIGAVVGAGGIALTDVQRQQLALARVHLHDPHVLVLDEAASEAGSADGDALDDAALRIARGRTTLTIAHRLGQARAADRIVVMDAGRIVEEGTHEQLLSAGGGYARLWRASR